MPEPLPSVPETITVVWHVSEWPLPYTVKVNVVVVLRFETTREPERSTSPISLIQPLSASLEPHVSVVEPPFETDVGDAEIQQLGSSSFQSSLFDEADAPVVLMPMKAEIATAARKKRVK